MSTGEARRSEPTADSLLEEMLGEAIGMDSPMSTEALARGTEVVQARLANARAIFDGAAVTADNYDTKAMAALMLIGEEREAQERRSI